MELVTLLTPKHTSCQLGSLTEWVSSPSYQMHDSYYRNICGLKLVHDAERKSLRRIADASVG